jgi:succinoglycan biosynthesis transport protein ExoP
VTEDAERQLKMKGLGIVPKVVVPENGEGPREGKAPRIVQETFRMIRTNLITKSDFGDKRQVVMVTSSLPKEGKSMFAFNLAESFANLGERTLLIDLDLRRGHLNRCFNQSREPGITEYLLSAENGAINCCRATHNEMLNFVPGGQRVDNVTELLATSTFVDFMARVRCQYDRIVIDTPPALGLAETTGMLPLVDGVVMVVQPDKNRRRLVIRAADSFATLKIPLLGIVVNRVGAEGDRGYYEYGGGYGYGADYAAEETEDVVPEPISSNRIAWDEAGHGEEIVPKRVA